MIDSKPKISVISVSIIFLLFASSSDIFARPDFNARILHSGYRSIQHRLNNYRAIIDSIYIDNSGDEDLEWELEIETEVDDWIAINVNSGTVRPNGRNWVVVSQWGSYVDDDFVLADLNFTSNDPTRDEYTIPVIGWKIDFPRIEVGWNNGWGEWWGIDMNRFIDDLSWGNIYEFPITIRNRWGGARLEVEDLECTDGYFELDPTEFNLDNNRNMQVTITFTAEEVGYHTTTITSVSNAWDPQELNFRIVGEVAAVFRLTCLLPDMDMDEDDEERIIADLDTIFISSSRSVEYRVAAAPGMVSRIERNGEFYLRPRSNWNGVSEVIVAASIPDSTIADTFQVFVAPLPDRPGSFDLILPSDSAVIHPTEFDTLFVWQASIDPDGDTLSYDLTITSENGENEVTFGDLYDTTLTTSVLGEVMDMEVGGLFTWHVVARDSSHERRSLSIFTNYLAPAGVEDRISAPASVNLVEIYPNPFNNLLLIKIYLNLLTPLHIQIYDLEGRLVSSVYDGVKQPGNHIFAWEPVSTASGRYLVSVETGEQMHVYPVIFSK